MHRITLSLILSAVGFAAANPACRAAAAEGVVPENTAVLLLPALDATVDSAHMQPARQLAIRREVEYAFITRHFKVLGEAMAEASASLMKPIDLSQLSERAEQDLDTLGARAGANWAVNLVVLDVKMDSSASGQLGGGFLIRTHVLLQIRDCTHKAWVANGDYTSNTKGAGSPIFVFKESLEAAANESLSAALSKYAQVVPVARDGAITDYLAGQTMPFLGDTGSEFRGLSSR